MLCNAGKGLNAEIKATKETHNNSCVSIMSENNTSRRVERKVSDSKTVEDYFVRTSIFHYLCVSFGFLLFWYIAFTNHTEILMNIGGPGQRLLYLRHHFLIHLRIGFFLAILVHILEALYTIRVATELKLNQETTQKWVIQTAIVGYSSLQHLLEFRSKQLQVKRK